jgi:hypothetical protein
MCSGSPGEGVHRLLDLAFGLFVWAAHLLAVYATTAVACVLGLGVAASGARSTFTAVLVVVTVAAAVIVALHALKTYRRHAGGPDRRSLTGITIGADAVAAVGILWQLYPILLVPACQ